MYKKILVPLDGSPLSEAVLPHVRTLIELGASEVVLMRVPDYPIFQAVRRETPMLTEACEQIDAQVKAYLSSKADELRTDSCRVETELTVGMVADAILESAIRHGADLIAMSTHGRSGFSRWLIGSVADKVLQAAQTPVLLIRPKKPADA